MLERQPGTCRSETSPLLLTALLKALCSSAPEAPLSGERHGEHLRSHERGLPEQGCSPGCSPCSSEQPRAAPRLAPSAWSWVHPRERCFPWIYIQRGQGTGLSPLAAAPRLLSPLPPAPCQPHLLIPHGWELQFALHGHPHGKATGEQMGSATEPGLLWWAPTPLNQGGKKKKILRLEGSGTILTLKRERDRESEVSVNNS